MVDDPKPAAFIKIDIYPQHYAASMAINWSAGILSRHNRSFLIVLLAWIVVFLVFYAWSGPTPEVGTVLGAIAVTGVIAIVQMSISRLATVKLFASEIAAIGKVFESSDMIAGFNAVARDPTSFFGGFVDGPRASDYFAIFHARSADLGALNAPIVRDVAEFYTFLKASRDAIQGTKRWTDDRYKVEQKQRDIIVTLQFCRMLAQAASRALQALVEDPIELKAMLRPFEKMISQIAPESFGRPEGAPLEAAPTEVAPAKQPETGKAEPPGE